MRRHVLPPTPDITRSPPRFVVVPGWQGQTAVVDGDVVYLAEQESPEATQRLAGLAKWRLRLRNAGLEPL